MPSPLTTRRRRRALLLAIALGCAGTAAAADLRETPHNLTRNTRIDASDTGQICVFCHTPTDTDPDDAAKPLWQKSLPETFSFLMFDDIGRMGFDGSNAVGSQSIACLSCHDAAQAFAVTGMTFDHPFGVPYAGARSHEERVRAREAARETGTPMSEARLLKFESEFRPAYRGIVDNRPTWWASRDGEHAQRRRDDLPLFARTVGEKEEEVPFIECASCHDPHSTNTLFLRVTQANASICLTCHIK